MLRRGLAFFLILAACGGGDDGGDDGDASVDAEIDAFVMPVLRNPVSLPDLELAQQAAALLGEGGAKNCDRCHALTRDRLLSWDTESNVAEGNCLTNVAPTTQTEALAIIDCFRATPGVATSGWPPHNLGIYNTAAKLPWFAYLFQLGFGPSEWQTQYDLFLEEAAMPRSDSGTFTQPEWDIVAEWFARGLPQLDAVIPGDPPITQCQTQITAEVTTHVNTMRTQGWRALNQDAGILMFGCAGASTTRDCLSTYPAASANTWSSAWTSADPGSVIRILRINNYSSSYWTRSSADGRYVAHGGASVASQTYRSTIIDLAQDREIPAAALYDPGFFPDNSGFALQGGSARFCEQSLLATNPVNVTFDEPQCIRTTAVGLYQHLSAAAGGDYWTVDGQFDNDNGGHSPTLTDTTATFSSTASIDLTPMVHEGTQFQPRPRITKSVPHEGDVVISPSARLLVSRVSGASGSQSGFILRKMVTTPVGSTYEIDIPEIARYCLRGGKPGFSMDERWMAYHHYVEANDWQALGYASATDPGFVALRQSGAANVFLLELATGTVYRITNMNAGQYALYPHFRSDGWLYFMVRDINRGQEYVVASDAALAREP